MMLRATTTLLLISLASTAQAKTCKVTIESTDQMQYDQKELTIAGECVTVELTLKHTGTLPVTTMGHNWVLAKTSEFRPLAIAGGRASAAESYLPKDDARVIAHTPLIGGGESTTITFATSALEKGGDYTFFCSFPGHWGVMKGKLVFA